MRVLIINKFLYPNGGSETYIFKLGEALEQHGHEVQYFGIQYFLKHREEADSSAEKFKRFLENECSEEKYAKTLWGMLAG